MTSCLILLACLTVSASGFLLTSDPSGNLLELIYFNGRGRAEISRLLFAAAKMPYVDTRVKGSDWAAMKPTTPYGHLPMLNVSGVIYTQSLAVQNYIAKVTGLYPASDLDQLMTDQIAFAREDLLIAQGSVNSATDNTTLMQTTIPTFLGNFNRYIAENPAKSGFVIGDKLSMADIVIYEGTENIFRSMPAMLDPFPEIKALRLKVAAADGISQWLAARPSTW